jgi:hypothetical protein
MNYFRKINILKVIAIISITSFLFTSAYSYSGGITGYSGNPATNGGLICTSCHGGGSPPTVALSGPLEVSPGSNNTYILTISGGQEAFGGIDVSVTDGLIVSIESGTIVSGGELIHIWPRTAVNGIVTFEFNWTAPSTSGDVTLYASGNSVNNDGMNLNDYADKDRLIITVVPSTTMTSITTTVTTTITSIITSTPPSQTVTTTRTELPITTTSTITATSTTTETIGLPVELTYGSTIIAIIAIIAVVIILIRK